MALAIIARQSYDSALFGVLIIDGNMTIRPLAIVVCTIILGVVFVAPGARAQELYSGVYIHKPDFMAITIIFGPFFDDLSCDEMREISQTKLQSSCPTCTMKYSRCFQSSDLHATYRKILDEVRVTFPYVIATEVAKTGGIEVQARTIFSEGDLRELVDACEALTAKMRKGDAPSAFCMRPSN